MKKITLQAIVIILLAACFYFYEFIVQVSPGAIQQDFMRDFAIDATKFGLISGCFYLAYTPLQLLSGLLLDRYSIRVILTCICATFAAGALLFSHAHNIYIAAVARFIMGGAASCAFISVLHLIAHWMPAKNYAFFAGILEMMGALGGLCGIWLFTLLLKNFDWRTATTGLAYGGFILAILIILIVKNNPSVKNNTIKIINKSSIWTDLKIILRNKQSWSIGLYSFLIWAPVLAFSALWGREFLCLNHSINKLIAAQAIACGWLGIAIASPIIGWLSDLIHKRCIIMTCCGMTGTMALLSIIFMPNLNIYILYFLMLMTGFASSGQTLSFALIKDNNTSHTNSAANGFNNMLIVASGFLFQPLTGKILDMYWMSEIQNGVQIYSLHGYQMAFSLLALCYFLAAIVSMFLITPDISKT